MLPVCAVAYPGNLLEEAFESSHQKETVQLLSVCKVICSESWLAETYNKNSYR
jgi:hypothetical protein